MNAILTLTSKNQVTLPVELVRLWGLTKGSKFWTKLKDNTLVIEKVDTWDDLQGILADTPMAKRHTVEEAIEIGRKREGFRLAKKHG